MESYGVLPMEMVHHPGGVVLNMDAEAVIRLSPAGEDTRPPPRVILHFCRRMIFPLGRAIESHYFTITDQLYRNITDEAVWEVETRRMLTRVAADNVPPVVLDFLGRVFRRYTYATLSHFSVAELSAIEFFSVIVIPPIAPFMSPWEIQRYRFWDEDYIEPVVGPAPAPGPETEVEALRMRIAEEPGSCSICLDELDTVNYVFEMPCRHLFHFDCLIQWLGRSNTCPLCRFTLASARRVAPDVAPGTGPGTGT